MLVANAPMMRWLKREVFDRSQGRSDLVRDNPPMHFLRHAPRLARFVLVWFALSIGAAMASPLIKPQPMEVICTGSGAMKVLVQTDDGLQELVTVSMDCPLCGTVGAPPPAGNPLVEPSLPLAYLAQGIPAARLASLTAAPLPARGPPLSS